MSRRFPAARAAGGVRPQGRSRWWSCRRSGRGFSAPTLVVTVRHDDLTIGRGIAWAGDRPVSLATAAHTGCAGAVETVIVGSTGRILGLGSRDRCFTGQQRRAITTRDRGCIIPGCHVPDQHWRTPGTLRI